MTPIQFRESDPRDVVSMQAADDARRSVEGEVIPPYDGMFPEIYARDFARKMAFLTESDERPDLSWAKDYQFNWTVPRPQWGRPARP